MIEEHPLVDPAIVMKKNDIPEFSCRLGSAAMRITMRVDQATLRQWIPDLANIGDFRVVIENGWEGEANVAIWVRDKDMSRYKESLRKKRKNRFIKHLRLYFSCSLVLALATSGLDCLVSNLVRLSLREPASYIGSLFIFILMLVVSIAISIGMAIEKSRR